jgi:hypothetical protein
LSGEKSGQFEKAGFLADFLQIRNIERVADLILALHFAYVLTVVLPVLLIPLGAKLGWRWVRSRKWRIIHLAMMGIVLVEALAGIICPLTWLENILRGTNSRSFLSDWVAKMMFYEFPAFYFTLAYLLFFACILALWYWIPPHAGRKNGSPQ